MYLVLVYRANGMSRNLSPQHNAAMYIIHGCQYAQHKISHYEYSTSFGTELNRVHMKGLLSPASVQQTMLYPPHAHLCMPVPNSDC